MNWKLTFGILVMGLFGWNGSAKAVPAPLPLPELCKQSDVIVTGRYLGGQVTKPKDCQFWVTFQVKPDKYFKKPAGMDESKAFQFTKGFFVDNKKCANVPGPNAMPGEIQEHLSKPAKDKKLFFLKAGQGQLHQLTSVFWSIVGWDKAPKEWHKEFKETPSCHSTK